MGVDEAEVEDIVMAEISSLPEHIMAQFDDMPVEFWAEVQDFSPEAWEALAQMEVTTAQNGKWAKIAARMKALAAKGAAMAAKYSPAVKAAIAGLKDTAADVKEVMPAK